LLLLAIVVGGVAAGYVWYRRLHREEDGHQLVLQGNVDVRQVNLAFKVEGRIVELGVDEGDRVKSGQVIAAVDPRYFEDELRMVIARRNGAAATLEKLEHGSRPEEKAEARARVAEARATLDRAQQDFDRAQGLVGKGAVSQETYDQARAVLAQSQAQLKYVEEAAQLVEIGPRKEDIEAARAQLQGEEAAILQSQRRLDDSKLIAPSAGIVLTRAREKGAIVAPGETVFAVTLQSPVWVRTYVEEPDLGKVHEGMKAEVSTDSSSKIYVGHVGFISPVAEFTPKTVETRSLRTDLVYRLRIVVDNPDNGLRQGMPVTVNFKLDKAE
jgi:HlyD family secretion protein